MSDGGGEVNKESLHPKYKHMNMYDVDVAGLDSTSRENIWQPLLAPSSPVNQSSHQAHEQSGMQSQVFILRIFLKSLLMLRMFIFILDVHF